MTLPIIEELREEAARQSECLQKQQPYTNCAGHLDRAADTIEQFYNVLAWFVENEGECLGDHPYRLHRVTIAMSGGQ
jgi:hypothetical protein